MVARSIANSLCFGIYEGSKQVGFARVISDYATFAYLADVFVIEAYRGRGLSKALMDAVTAHPHLQDLPPLDARNCRRARPVSEIRLR